VRKGRRTADGVILEAEGFHFLGREQVPAIDDQRASHGFVNAPPVELLEFLPFGDNQQSLGVARRSTGIGGAIEVREAAASFFHGLRIIGAKARAGVTKALDQLHRGSEADVVGIGLEGQAEDANLLVLEHPERIVNDPEKTIDTLAIDALGFAQHGEIHAVALGETNEGLKILGEAESAEAEAGT
jgi:hypothetical protein